MGAPVGNTNAFKGRLWNAAIQRALEKRSKGEQVQALDELAEKLLALCEQGEISALRELGDRLDGKPHQTADVTHRGSLHDVLSGFGKTDDS